MAQDDSSNQAESVNNISKNSMLSDSDAKSTPEKISEEPGESGDRDIQNLVYTIPVDHSGTSVYVKGWMQLETELPPVVLVHDLGENVRKYKNVGQALSERGFSVFCFDLRGHGRSGRMLGYVPNFESLVADLLQVVAWIRHKCDRKRPIIIGQGVGGLVTLFFKKAYPAYMSHAILIAPVISDSKSMSPFYRAMIRVTAEMFPRMRLPRKVLFRVLSLGGSAAKKQKNGAITFNFAREVLNAITQAPQVFASLKGPAMIVAPQQSENYDLATLKIFLQDHPEKDNISLVEVSNIGTQPLSNKDEFAVVLESIYPWLESQFDMR